MLVSKNKLIFSLCFVVTVFQIMNGPARNVLHDHHVFMNPDTDRLVPFFFVNFLEINHNFYSKVRLYHCYFFGLTRLFNHFLTIL